MAPPRVSSNGHSTMTRSSSRAVSFKVILSCVACCVLSFYSGLLLGMNHSHGDAADCHCKEDALMASKGQGQQAGMYKCTMYCAVHSHLLLLLLMSLVTLLL